MNFLSFLVCANLRQKTAGGLKLQCIAFATFSSYVCVGDAYIMLF